MNFNNLDVYQCALKFLSMAHQLIPTLGKGDGDLKDQLRRAALSIPLNIAEASGKITNSDRARFFAIARGSAMECAAILDCTEVIHPNSALSVDPARVLIGRIIAMLTKLARPQ
jgi:four helix bundle protein